MVKKIISLFTLLIFFISPCKTQTNSTKLIEIPVSYPAWVPLLNVKDFGAVGDGKADDTYAIQRAIQSKKTSRQLYFPQGTYLVSKPLISFNSDSVGQAWLQLYGSGKGTTTIQLINNAVDFQDIKNPVALIQFRAAREPVNGVWLERPNVAFFNSIYDMTIDIGAGNPGAIGIDWIVCNAGSLRHVNIVSSDPQKIGSVGVRMHDNDGTSFMRDVTIDGFDYGWWRSDNAQSLAAEGLYLKNQRKAGIYNLNSVFAVHDLHSENKVPTLIQVEGTAQASILTARINGGASEVFVQGSPESMLYLRDILAKDSKTLVKRADGSIITSLSDEWFSHPAASNGQPASLNLPVKQAPEYHNNDTTTWVMVSNFSDDGTGDYSVRLQKAIDSGAETIVMDGSGSAKYQSSVTVRGNVKRMIGFWQSSAPAKQTTFVKTGGHDGVNRINDALNNGKTIPEVMFLRIENSESNLLIIERFHHFPGGILNNSSRTVVFRDMGVLAYTNTPEATGDLFIEGCMGARYQIRYGQHAWFRSVDAVFGPGPDILVDGSIAWILSNRTEGGGAFVEATNGASAEVISSSQFIGSNGVGDDIAYISRNSHFSIVNFSDMGFMKHGAYQTLVKEINDGKEIQIGRNSKGVFKRNNLNKMMVYRSGE